MNPRDRKFDLKAEDHLGTCEGKRLFNERHFAVSAPRYDLATKGLSLGRDGSWKRALVAGLPDLESPVCLDVACGTGDIALLLARKYPEGRIHGIDLTPAMIRIAEERGRGSGVNYHVGEMDRIELPDRSVDVLTGGYALRNAPDLDAALEEFARVLKPGGRAAFLDFSKPPGSRRQRLQRATMRWWGGLWGLLLHGNPEIHGYISASLESFPDRDELLRRFARHGFRLERSRSFLFGATLVHFLQYSPS